MDIDWRWNQKRKPGPGSRPAVIIVGRENTLQQWLLRAGLVIAAVLLIRFAVDFSRQETWWLAAPFVALAGATLWIAAENVFSRPKAEGAIQPRGTARLLLTAAIPLAFLASSLGCSGLALRGCSDYCTFVKLLWIPLIAVVCAGYYVFGGARWLTVICLMSVVPLFPHCVCYNAGNAWWIDRIGASPVCYVWGFAVSVVAVAALRRGVRLGRSLVVSLVVIGGATGFFVSHHYFRFPW